MDFSQFALTVMKHVRNYVQPALDELVKRIDEREGALRKEFDERIAAIPSGKDGGNGSDGLNGKDADESAIEQRISERVTKRLEDAIAAVPVPKDGRDGKDGERGSDGLNGKDADESAIESRIDQRISKRLDDAIASIPAPKDGRDGINGKDADPELVANALRDEVLSHAKAVAEAAVKQIEIPVAKDGRNGVDGKSVTAAEVLDAMQPEITKWALDFERRAQDILHRAVENIPKPANGKDGKDGIDGLGFDDLTVEQLDERHIVLRFTRGDVVKEFPVELAGFVDRGVFKHGETYERGDSVSWGGSTFFAQKRAPEGEPGASADWRLGVKRGRDGKDGVVKTIDPNATVKIPK